LAAFKLAETGRSSTGWVRVTTPGYDESDWMLNPVLHQMLLTDWTQAKRRPFSVDCAASNSNAFYEHYYTSTRSFLESSSEVLGKSLWCNPPYRENRVFC